MGSREIVGAALFTVLAGGCATAWVYEKPGASPDVVAQDKAACRAEAIIPTVSVFHAEKVDVETFNQCMQSRGYTIRVARK